MTNTFATPKVYANVGLKLLLNNLVMGKLVDTESLSETFAPGAGKTVYVKRPPEFKIRTGSVASAQDTVQGEVAVSLGGLIGVDAAFTSTEMTSNVDALLKSDVIKAAMATIAQDIDSQIGLCLNEFHNVVGTPGNAVASPADFFKAPQRLDEMAIPVSDRNAVMTPGDTYSMAGNILALAAQQGDVAKSALLQAKIPMLGNVESYMSQSTPTQATGTRAVNGTLINGANQNVAYSAVRTTYSQSLITDGQISKTHLKGETFTIAGCYAINPRTRAAMPYLLQFTLLADQASDGAGNATFTISPPIISDPTSPYQNVSAAPADNAAITWLGALSSTFRPNAAFHKSSIKLVSGKLPMPFTGEADFATDPKTGISIRYWRYSDGTNDVHNHRWDVYCAAANVDRRLGVRFYGQ